MNEDHSLARSSFFSFSRNSVCLSWRDGRSGWITVLCLDTTTSSSLWSTSGCLVFVWVWFPSRLGKWKNVSLSHTHTHSFYPSRSRSIGNDSYLLWPWSIPKLLPWYEHTDHDRSNSLQCSVPVVSTCDTVCSPPHNTRHLQHKQTTLIDMSLIFLIFINTHSLCHYPFVHSFFLPHLSFFLSFLIPQKALISL